MIEVAIRTAAGDATYHRREMFDAEPLPGDGVSFGELEDFLVLRVQHRLHMTGEDAYLAINAEVVSHYGDDVSFALLNHGFKRAES